MTDLSKSQLNTILSALDGKQRNPNTKDAALKAIARHGERLGLTTDDLLAAAGGLLDGRMSEEDLRAMLRYDGDTDEHGDDAAPNVAEPVEDAPVAATAAPAGETDETVDDAEPAEDYVMPNAGPLAVTPLARVNSRPDTKQALMIAMLKRPEGATVEQIAEATNWQKHTVRGAMAGALKKKLGLAITSEKVDGARVYRIAE